MVDKLERIEAHDYILIYLSSMHALIKNWVLSYVVEELPEKQTYDKEWEILTPGIDFDEAIEFDFDGPPEYIDGKIVLSPSYIQQKKNEKKNEIITAVDLSQVDLDEFQFSDIEIGEIITARVFWGNPYAQQALQAKILSMLTSWEKNEEVIAKSEYVKEEINKVRTLFNLSSI